MTAGFAADRGEPSGAVCWCCGAENDPARMVHLGNHPEVGLCLGCARWTARQARDVEDRDRTGLAVTVRDMERRIRDGVIRRGLHHNRIIGGPLRWLGKKLP